MSESIKHECGIAFIRFRQPLSYYVEKYKTHNYGLNKLYLMMQKQRNRGQDGAGIATLKMNLKPGGEYIHRYRSTVKEPIDEIFKQVGKKVEEAAALSDQVVPDSDWIKENVPYIGEMYMGHLRYGTHGENTTEKCHPMIRNNNWRSRNLVVAGNFNLTNAKELFERLIELGQHPKEKTDTVTVMEKIGHFLDEENQSLFDKYNNQGLTNQSITERIENEIDMKDVLIRACRDFDGGYVMMGMVGHGGAFIARDAAGIRPAHYYADDEVIVVASEKSAIKTVFNVEYQKIKEIPPASALIIDKQANFYVDQYIDPLPRASCSFERIYFSRGSDPEIYAERKKMGEILVPQILEKIDYNLEDTVFGYIPNTAETSFLGMIEGMEQYLIDQQRALLAEKEYDHEKLDKLLGFRPRVEKLVIKDAKFRTFITEDSQRDDIVAHAYDTTYEVIRKGVDTLVVIDDSIVRGTTLEKSIVSLLDKLEPKKIVVVSAAPQIRYPDCYGIDMSKMKEFVAFRAMLRLLDKKGKNYLLEEVYKRCREDVYKLGIDHHVNHVKELFDQFTDSEISDEVARIIRQPHINAQVEVVYQTVENLHKAAPNDTGDWYFTGNYPTPGGHRVVNRSFLNFFEGKHDLRAY